MIEPNKRILLQHWRVADTRMIPKYVRETSVVDAVKTALDDLILSLTAYVLTQHVSDERQSVTFHVPASWWQHFKMSKMPKWFTDRWPVRYAALTKDLLFSRHLQYPNASIVLPPDRFGQTIVFDRVTDYGWDRNESIL